MTDPIILYDGWPLVYAPNSPAALHLLAVLAQHPADFAAHLALPGAAPDWLPAMAQQHPQPAPGTVRSRLRWEQRILPRLAAQLGATWLHCIGERAPLFGSTPNLFSPAAYPGSIRRAGFWERLEQAAGQGGIARARAVLWPEDIAAEEVGYAHPRLKLLPPVSALAKFSAASSAALELPETFILYHGPGRTGDIERLLAAWSWAAGAIGVHYPLVAVGLEQQAGRNFLDLAASHELEESVRLLPSLAPAELATVYRRCTCLFHPVADISWGSAVRQALAFEKPVVAAAHPLTEARVGPAAYLAAADDLRGLGAGLITLIVEPDIAEKLSAAARGRAALENGAEFERRLRQAYLEDE